jgi:hypothetical protein
MHKILRVVQYFIPRKSYKFSSKITYNYQCTNMKDIFILQGKNYISARRASEISDYSSDYIGQLCRSKKIDSVRVGRIWYVSEKSLSEHKSRVAEVESDPRRVLNIFLAKIEKSKISVLDKSAAPRNVTDSSQLQFASDLNHEPAQFSVKPAQAAGSFAEAPHASPLMPDQRYVSMTIFAALVILVGGGIFFSSWQSDLKLNSTETSATVYDALKSLGTIFTEAYASVLALFDHGSSLSVNGPVQEYHDPSGMVVEPSSALPPSGDQVQKIQDTFSDSVSVSPDKSGTVGVITPSFKGAADKKYTYVLVPVKPKGNPSQSGTAPP